jgi:hypothetical protein
MELSSYQFEGSAVRTLTQGGEPWFVLSDVAAVLGVVNSRHVAVGMPTDEKGVVTADTLGGPQKLTIISEAGLYRMIFQSRKPSAERFKSWVVRDVLPAIRKTGGYQMIPAGPGTVEDIRGLLLSAAAGVVAGTMDVSRAKVVAQLAAGWMRAAGKIGRGGRPALELDTVEAVDTREADDLEALVRMGVRGWQQAARLDALPPRFTRTLRDLVEGAREQGWTGGCLQGMAGRGAETQLGLMFRRYWAGRTVNLDGRVYRLRKRVGSRRASWVFEAVDG